MKDYESLYTGLQCLIEEVEAGRDLPELERADPEELAVLNAAYELKFYLANKIVGQQQRDTGTVL